jgi:hypothetical protein
MPQLTGQTYVSLSDCLAPPLLPRSGMQRAGGNLGLFPQREEPAGLGRFAFLPGDEEPAGLGRFALLRRDEEPAGLGRFALLRRDEETRRTYRP